MIEDITFEKYAAVKNVIYQRYSILEKADDSRLEAIFSSFDKLKNVARNTYLFPYDAELWEDMKTINQEHLLTSKLQEKYNISDGLLLEKFREYHVFEFGKLLYSTELFDLEAMDKFHFSDNNDKKIV